MVRLPKEQYQSQNAASPDVFWVIGVSDSTLERDRGEKLAAYAGNAIPEYWVLNLGANEIEIHRESEGKNYLLKRTLKPSQAASPLELPDTSLIWWQ